MAQATILYRVSDGTVLSINKSGETAGAGEALVTTTVPPGALPRGSYYDSAADAVVAARPPKSDNQQLKDAARAWTGAIRTWHAQLQAESPGYPSVLRDIGHDFLAGAVLGGYLVAQFGGLSATGLRSFFQAASLGAADCTSAAEFFQRTRPLTVDQIPPNTYPPLSWVDPDDASRWNLNAVVVKSAALFVEADGYTDDRISDARAVNILGGAWIASL